MQSPLHKFLARGIMDNMNKILKQLEKQITKRFDQDSSGHDIYHLKRVLNNAITIQKSEGGDRLIIGIAAFLHDIHRSIGGG